MVCKKEAIKSGFSHKFFFLVKPTDTTSFHLLIYKDFEIVNVLDSPCYLLQTDFQLRPVTISSKPTPILFRP